MIFKRSLRNVFFVVALCMFAAWPVSAQQKTNIIFIMADDLGYASIGAFGQKIIKTPNLDRMAAGGMLLTQFYANPICSPSRASLITGMHSGHSLVRDNYELGGYEDSTEFGQFPLARNMFTVGRVMRSAGYKTAVFGKWGLGGPGSTGVPWKQGFDFFYGYLDQKQAHNYYPNHLWRNEELDRFPNAVTSAHQQWDGRDPADPASYDRYKGEIYSCDTITAEAMKYIRSNSADPFFVYLAYTLPHMALQVPDKYVEQYAGKFDDKPLLGGGYLPHRTPRAAYAAMISLLDDYVGRIMQLLVDLNIDKNTLIIFTGDNGAAAGGGVASDYFECSGNLKGRKGSLYEGGIREPFIAYWPGVIKAGSKSEHIAALWDMLPTFAEVGGAHLDKDMPVDGISILPELMGKKGQQRHEFLYWEIHRPQKGMQAVRFGDWKAVIRGTHADTVGRIELYNLKNDIAEKYDLSQKYPAVVDRAKKYLYSREIAPILEWNFYVPPKPANN
ncbi:MAG: arylsulfatase [Chitinophagaceae bacterium]|nr:arylsulfatase [Chitinophagaceae bacterium]